MKAIPLACLAILGEVLQSITVSLYVWMTHILVVYYFAKPDADDIILKQIEKIDVVTAAMGHALATEGGFCTGNARIIDYQVNHDHADE